MIPAFWRQQIEREPVGNSDDHLVGLDRLARAKDNANGATSFDRETIDAGLQADGRAARASQLVSRVP